MRFLVFAKASVVLLVEPIYLSFDPSIAPASLSVCLHIEFFVAACFRFEKGDETLHDARLGSE